MKRSLLILTLILSGLMAKADHITGGEMYYRYNGVGTAGYSYTVTLKLFMRCNSGRQFPDPAIISIFNKSDNSRFRDVSVNMTSRETIKLNGNENPCITDPPEVCYEVAYYTFTVTLPASAAGYTMASEVNYRIRGISNLRASQVGATYTCDVPGTNGGVNAPANHSATFTGSDLVIVCSNNFFSYSFAAEDNDNDQLRYSFCKAYASTTGGVNGVPAGSPPYMGLPYNTPEFDETAPLGLSVSIDPITGLITGVAPSAGIYVVTVCADEIRNNVVIATQRKDVQINITDCSIAGARLEKDYMVCRSSRSLTINNLSNSPLIVSFDWTVFNPAGNPVFSTTNQVLTYNFPVDGIYRVRLIVNKDQQCSDTADAPVYVFPGTVTNFNAAGICITKPTLFTDQSSSPSGTVNSWQWDFGEPSTTADISLIKNPVYTYPETGTKIIKLTITVSNGCRDTVSKTITVIDKPPITLAFRDTLICLNDQLQLQAAGNGSFNWSPAVNLVNPGSPTPIVSPATTTKYYVDLNSDGCLNRDSVLVRVVDHVTLQLMGDTTICTNDTIALRVQSDGLKYAWTPAGQLLDPAAQSPLAITPGTTVYQVLATIGGCSTNGSIRVTTVDYPTVNAGADTTICYQTSAQLLAFTNAISWQWSPASSLSNASTALNPVATPPTTTNYVLTAYRLNSGCPKPSRDSVLITVLPPIIPFAGNDTAVIIGQPLQLNATGGERYEWSPAAYLTASNIPNPVAVFTEPSAGIRYKVKAYNSAGCADSSYINIKVFATGPTVFVPSAFTPNNDGKNDLLIPIAVGMQRLDYFNIYNRWGQLVYSAAELGRGWNGRVGGHMQTSNTYVWTVKAIDYRGVAYFAKGMVTLVK